MTTKLKSEIESEYTQKEVDEVFPNVATGIKPFGSRVVVQIRSPRKQTQRGLLLPDDVQEVELWNTQTGMVREIGPVAFRNRTTLEKWPEGAWVKEGMFVRIPKYNQDKWWIEYDTGLLDSQGKSVMNKALFMMINDLDLLGEKVGNPLALKAYI